MRQVIWVVAAFIFLVVRPAFSDIADVSISGSVSGSGSLTVECGVGLMNPPQGCVNVFEGLYLQTEGYNFTATNPGLDAFSDSASAFALYGNLEGQADQSVTLGPDSIHFQLDASDAASAFLVSYNASDSSSVSAKFYLTVLSTYTLSDDFFSVTSDSDELFDSLGTVVSPSSIIAPGWYTFKASITENGSGGYLTKPASDQGGGFTEADFAPVPTPEPRWTALVFAILLAGYVVATRRKPRSA